MNTLAAFLIAFALSYAWHGMGVTIGYHRLLSHRSFTCPKLVEWFWVLGGYLAFEGSPIWWVAIHRAHHRYSDTPLDPHSPIYGVRHAYYGWMLEKEFAAHINPYLQCPDMEKDPIYRYMDQSGNWTKARLLTLFVGLAFRAVLFLCFGWAVALASLLAGVLVLQIPLLLNVACHMPRLGYKTYPTTDLSVNVWWVALLAMGEGWHNNHHAFPGSARSGLKRSEIDMSWLTLRFLKLFGLVGWMHEASTDTEFKRLLAPVMDEPKLHESVR